MLNLGVDLNYNQVNITALSEGFAFLDELELCMGYYESFSPWLDSLRLKNDEPLVWIFCEKRFYEWNGPFFFYEDLKESHSFFLVKDRIIVNLHKLCVDLFSRRIWRFDFNVSYLLAAARAFIDDSYITPFYGPFKKMVDKSF